MLPLTLTLRLALTSPLPLGSATSKLSPRRLTLKSFYFSLLFLKLIVERSSKVQVRFYTCRPLRTLFMTTRAPYRNKLTRNQYLIQRYRYTLVFQWLGLGNLSFSQGLALQKLAQNWGSKLDLAHVTVAAVQAGHVFQAAITENGWT